MPWWILAAALAQEVADAPAAAPGPPAVEVPTAEAGVPPGEVPAEPASEDVFAPSLDDLPVYEVVVWGEDALRESRSEVAEAFEAQGWEHRHTRDGVMVFRPPEAWKGSARLHSDGRLDFSRPVVVPAAASASPTIGPGEYRPRMPTGQMEYGADIDRETGPGASMGPYTATAQAEIQFLVPGKRKVEAAQTRVLREIYPQLARHRAVIRETAYQESLQFLPARLDAVWELGAPLVEGDPELRSLEDRRAAVLDFWATRADTPEGEGVRRVVELWVREVVMTSDAPVTVGERLAIESRAGRTLDLGVR